MAGPYIETGPCPVTLPRNDLTAANATPDWNAVQAETARLLQRLIQFDTRNPPGNEFELARHLETLFSAAEIETRLFEPAPGRGALVARIRGSGAARPVLLLAHMDVVAVETDKWTVDPFAGAMREGYVYGRGAIDDKGMLAVNAMTMLLLKRDGPRIPLERDVLFVATADEETGGEFGIEWLLRNEPDLQRAEFALNEGGRLRVVDGRLLYAAIQTAEKVSHVVTVTARGTSGHASVPLPDNAIATLAAALAAAARQREPVQLLPTTRRFLAQLSGVWPDPAVAAAMKQVASDDPTTAARAIDRLSQVPTLDAVLRTGISPTIVRGGSQSNVIPGDAQGVLCIRTLPGAAIDEVVRRLAAAVNDPRVEFTITERGSDAPESSYDCAMFRALERSLEKVAPGTVTVPYLSTGATDSAHLRRAGVAAYGLLPFPLEEGDERRMHAHDERVPVAALGFGTRLVFETIRRVAGPEPSTARGVAHGR